jgi:hypothetical protein
VKRLKQILSKINLLSVIQVLVMVALFVVPLVSVHAQLQINCPQGAGINCSQIGANRLNDVILTIINIILGVTFALAILFLIVGGFRYLTSAGNEEAAEKGKKTVINALIGIAIIILSFVLVNIVASFATRIGQGGTP